MLLLMKSAPKEGYSCAGWEDVSGVMGRASAGRVTPRPGLVGVADLAGRAVADDPPV